MNRISCHNHYTPLCKALDFSVAGLSGMRRHYALLHRIRKSYEIVKSHPINLCNYYTWPSISRRKHRRKLGLIKLPPGFSISLYASGVENSRQLVIGDNGTVFAGSTKAGKVHAVVDSDGDHRADRVLQIDDELKLPSGVEFRDGALFVAALDRLLRYDNIEAQLEQPPQPTVLRDDWPDKTHHGWKYLRFGPDSKLYVPIGAPCNICDEPNFSQIRRLNVETGDIPCQRVQ